MGEGEKLDAGELRGQLAALAALPPFPATVDALLRPAESRAADIVAACARRDPALLAYLLKQRDAVCAPETLAHATSIAAVLGGLAPALATQLIADAPLFDGGESDARALVVWPRAIRTACLAETLAQVANAPAEDGGKAYALGLLLDIGALALYRQDAAGYAPILREHENDLPALLTAERAHFGMTHSLAGRILADAWELPAEVRRQVWLQYQPRPASTGPESERVLPLALHWARRIAWGARDDNWAEAARAFSVDEDSLREEAAKAEDRAAALVQSAPAAAIAPGEFRARLGVSLSTRPSTAPQDALEWAEQALMAGEGSPAHAAAAVPPTAPPRDDTAAAMARALRAPISRISAHANAMLTAPGQADPALLRAIQEEGHQAERLLQDVLAYTEPVTMKPAPQLLNYFLRRYFQGIADRLRWRGIRLEMDLAEGLPRVPLDPAAFEQVLLNLAANAAQAMGDLGGVLTVSTQTTGDGRVAVRIADTGQGVDPAIASSAFEPFVKGADSGEGPGLGLAAARVIIEAHGGHISLEPNAEGGTVCTLTMPAAAGAATPTKTPPETPPKTPPKMPPEPARAPAPKERPLLRVVDVQPKQPATPPPAPSQPSPAATHTEADPMRLLMADPDFELGELLQELLGRRGFEVAFSREPAQALAEAGGGRFGQILVDSALRAPDGRPLAMALHEVLPGARVILTVTPGAPATEALEGVSALRLSKPFPVRALLSALQPAGTSRGA